MGTQQVDALESHDHTLPWQDQGRISGAFLLRVVCSSGVEMEASVYLGLLHPGIHPAC